MDARDRLRQYLQQRRELGETEFVLDGLPVAEALRLIGLRAGNDAPATNRPRSAGAQAPGAEAGLPGVTEGESGDWRSALRAIGAEQPPSAPKKSIADKSAASPEKIGRYEMPTDSGRLIGEPGAAGDVGSARSARSAGEAGGGKPSPSTTAMPETGIVVGHPIANIAGGPLASLESIDAVAAAVAACQLCGLQAAAKNPVPGEGSPHAGFVCVGEAPGATEDETGRPFVGQAGQLLTRILAAVGFAREDVFICNVLKHRPPGNRNPSPDEIRACSPWLLRQLELLQPRVILALGTFASQTLLQTTQPIGKLRGRLHRYYGVPLIVTYHPAALLRNPSWKRPTWEDVQLARRIFDNAATGA